MNPKLKITLILASLFFASLFFRALWLDAGAPLSGDEPDYDFLARQIIDGNGFIDENGAATAWRTPGFPVVLAAIYTIFGGAASAKIVLAIVSALGAVAVYLFSFFLFKKRVIALISGVAWTILPTSIVLAGSLTAENTALLFIVSAFLVAVVSPERKAFFAAIISGILIGAAILTRGYLIFIVLTLPVYFFFFKNLKKPALVCLLFSILLPLGWMIRNALVLNSFTLSTESAQVVWLGINRWTRGSWNNEWNAPDSEQKAHLREKYPGFFEISETERAKIYMNEAAGEITGNPSRILLLAPKKVAVFLSPKSYMGFDWVYLLSLPFAALGFFVLLRDRKQRAKLWLLVFPIVGVAAVCAVTFGDARFRHPVDFGFIILAGAGLNWIVEKLRKNPSNAV